MALEIGSEQADAGMSRAIFAEIDRLLSPPLEHAVAVATDDARPQAQEALDLARDGWRKLAFAIAKGVVGHILSSMEVAGVQARATSPRRCRARRVPLPPRRMRTRSS